MRQSGVKRFSRVLLSSLLMVTSFGLGIKSSLAQTACAAPKVGEYLLLIVSNTAEEQKVVQRTLPNDINREICRYLNDTVTRVGGFDDQLVAEDWAAYLQEMIGLPAYVVKQEATPARSSSNPVVRRTPSETSGSSQFNPRPLGTGYAVIVDFFNQPELAYQLETIIGEKVGLVSYGQRPYLLVEYTTDADAATATLKNLSSRGFWTMMVDGNRVTVISPNVQQ